MQLTAGRGVLYLNLPGNIRKGIKTMRHKASITKVLVASLIALLVCTSVGYSEGPQNPVDSRLTAASSKFSFKLYNELVG